MKNISEQILRFKRLSNLINEQGKSDTLNLKSDGFCESGNCKDGEGIYLGPLGSYKGVFKNSVFNDSSGNATLETNVSETDFPLENLGLTKNFHTHLFKYTGQFVNGQFDGKGRIEFSDGSIYEGDFNENKIAGIGTFTFKDGSVYQGKVVTEDVDGTKSKYILDYGDGYIDDVIDYNSKNTVEKIKLDSDDVSYDDDADKDFYDYTDLNVYFSETKGNSGVVKYVDKNKYPQIKGKKIKILLEYIGDKTIKKEGKIDTGYFKFEDVRIGRYNLTVDGKGIEKYKTIIDIDEDTKELTVLLKNTDMKENYLVDKIKKMLFESADNEKSTDKTKIKNCESSIEDFYNFYVMVYRGQQPLPKDTADLERKRIYVEKCAAWSNYSNFNKKTKEYIKRLMSVAPGTSQTIKFKNYFEIEPILPESKDIYSNSISNSIMRVLKEHSKNKNLNIVENNIIKNRLDFIYKSSNDYELEFNLLKESKTLIKNGYNENVVKTYYKRLIN